VSRDSVASHQKFKRKYGIPFRLIADVDSKLCNAFGVIADKNLYGRITKGVVRSTFLIDASGTILKVWPKVSVSGHASEVYESLP
jgi:peroxiredoxin Q/BCP